MIATSLPQVYFHPCSHDEKDREKRYRWFVCVILIPYSALKETRPQMR